MFCQLLSGYIQSGEDFSPRFGMIGYGAVGGGGGVREGGVSRGRAGEVLCTAVIQLA